jgi:hypothetical protein
MSSIINFPLDQRIGFKSGGVLNLSRKTTVLRSPFTGKRQTLINPYALWTYKGDLSMVDGDAAAMIRTFLVQLEGQGNKFRMPVPGYVGPSSNYGISPQATAGPFVNGAGQTGSSLNIISLIASTLIFKRGDYFTVNDELKLVTDDCWSNSSGLATVKFKPTLRASPVNGATLKIGKYGTIPSNNKLPYSNAFLTSPWTNSGLLTFTNPGTVQNALNSNLDAWSLIPSTANTQHTFSSSYVQIKPNVPFTSSLFVKTNGYGKFLLQMVDSQNQYAIGCGFDAATGVASTPYASTGGGRGVTTAVSISNSGLNAGWYRVTVTGTLDSDITQMQFYSTDASYSSIYAGNGTSGYYVYGAQIEESSVATYFHSTTDGEGVPTVLMSANTDDIASWIYDAPLYHSVTLDLIEAVE